MGSPPPDIRVIFTSVMAEPVFLQMSHNQPLPAPIQLAHRPPHRVAVTTPLPWGRGSSSRCTSA